MKHFERVAYSERIYFPLNFKDKKWVVNIYVRENLFIPL